MCQTTKIIDQEQLVDELQIKVNEGNATQAELDEAKEKLKRLKEYKE